MLCDVKYETNSVDARMKASFASLATAKDVPSEESDGGTSQLVDDGARQLDVRVDQNFRH